MDKSITRNERELSQCSLSSMAFLLCELVQYTTNRCLSHDELVSRIMNVGFEVGMRAVEIVNYRRDKGRGHLRPITMLEVMKQISSTLWPYLFGKQPDSLQRDDENDAKFYLLEDVPKFTKFMGESIRAQRGSSPLDTPGYFVAGIVKGYLNSAGFQAEVDAAWKLQSMEPKRRSVIIIQFSGPVIAREQRMSSSK